MLNKLEKLIQDGRLKKARKLIKQICQQDPNNANHWFQSGIINAQLNHLEDAASGFQKAFKLNPADTQACYNLAKVHQMQGNWDEAITAYQQSIQLNPALSESYNNLSSVFCQLGRLDDAKTMCEKLIQLKPNDAKAYFNLATVLKDQQAYTDAIQHFKKAINIEPNYGEAHHNLGACYLNTNDYLAAKEQFAHCLDQGYNSPDIHQKMGFALDQLKDYPKAISHYLKALKDKQGDAEIHAKLSFVYFNNTNYDKAFEHIQTAIDLNPDHAESYQYKGDIEKYLGNIDAAIASYQKAITLDPSYSLAHYSLAHTKKFKRLDDPDFINMVNLASKPDLTQQQTTTLSFALGKAYEDLSDYDNAFSRYQEANDLHRQQIDYDPSLSTQLIDTIIKTFNKKIFDQHSDYGIDDARQIFIVGMPRSGSTLTEQIISQQTDIFNAGEVPDFSHAMASLTPQLSELDAYLNAPHLSPEAIERLAQTYLTSIQHYADGHYRYITNKMLFNYQMIGMIKLAFPHAKIIHCLRDPIDTCLSCYKQFFKEGQLFSYDLKELGLYYQHYQQLMTHWHDVLPEFVFDFDYEQLINDPETQTQRLFEFLELPWNEDCLSFHQSKGAVHTASVAQVRQPLYKDAVKRWKKYEQHLKPLIDTLNPA